MAEVLTMAGTLELVKQFKKRNNPSTHVQAYEENKRNLTLAKYAITQVVDQWDYDEVLEEIRKLQYEIERFEIERKSPRFKQMPMARMEGEAAETLIETHDKEVRAINKRHETLNKKLDKLIESFIDAAKPIAEEVQQLELAGVATVEVKAVLPNGTKLVVPEKRQSRLYKIDEVIQGVDVVVKALKALEKNIDD